MLSIEFDDLLRFDVRVIFQFLKEPRQFFFTTKQALLQQTVLLTHFSSLLCYYSLRQLTSVFKAEIFGCRRGATVVNDRI